MRIRKDKNLEKKPNIVACIPAFNEENSIGSVIIKAEKYVDCIIICDDGSNDLTGEIAKRLGAIVVTNKQNLGKGAALKKILKYCLKLNPNYIVILDGDGQHNPEEIPLIVSPLENGEADMVIGSRYLKQSKNSQF